MNTTNAYIKHLDNLESEPFTAGLSFSISTVRVWYNSWRYLAMPALLKVNNQFCVTGLFPYPLTTLEKQRIHGK